VDLGRDTRTSTQSRRLVRRKGASWSLNWPSGANLLAHTSHYLHTRFHTVFHARHCRVPSKVPNGPSSRILLAVRSSSTSFHARLFDSVVRFGVSAGGAARLWCSTTIFFAKIYQFRVGFGNLYREAPFPRLEVVSCSRCSRANSNSN